MEKIKEYLKNNYRETAIVAIITFFALILRLIMLQNYGDLWLDELYSWYFASQNNVIDTVLELVKQDIHMPLYFVILHFWTRLFGQSDVAMHSCTLFLTLPLIPIAFYSMKTLFNKTVGYFSAILLTINAWGIYYSIEVRFYGFVFVLSILSAFSFAKMLETFDKKYIWAFIISHALLIYTFSATGMLTLMYALFAIIYLVLKRRDKLLEMAKYFSILLIVSIPVIAIMIYNTLVFNSEICSFTHEIYFFDWKVLFDMLETYFSSENYQLMTREINVYGNIFEKMSVPSYFILVAIPIFIGLVGFIRSLFSKNKLLYFFLIPSLMFLVVSLLLASSGKMAFLTRYSTIIYSVIMCSACYGLSLLNWKKVHIVLFSLWIFINYIYFYVVPTNIFTNPRIELGSLSKLLEEQVQIKDTDYVLIPYSGSKVMRYVPHGVYIPFEADDMLLLKGEDSLEFYFGTKDIDKKNVRAFMYDYITKNIVMEAYYNNLKKNYIDKMNRGDRLILISYRDGFTMPLIQNWQMLKDVNTYNNMNLFVLMMSKVTKDSLDIAQQTLKPLGSVQVRDAGYSIFVYEKQ